MQGHLVMVIGLMGLNTVGKSAELVLSDLKPFQLSPDAPARVFFWSVESAKKLENKIKRPSLRMNLKSVKIYSMF